MSHSTHTHTKKVLAAGLPLVTLPFAKSLWRLRWTLRLQLVTSLVLFDQALTWTHPRHSRLHQHPSVLNWHTFFFFFPLCVCDSLSIRFSLKEPKKKCSYLTMEICKKIICNANLCAWLLAFSNISACASARHAAQSQLLEYCDWRQWRQDGCQISSTGAHLSCR